MNLPHPISVDILLWEGVELLDFAGPGQVFAVAGGGRAFRPRTVAARPGPVRSQGFLTVKPDLLLEDVPPGGILVVPGGASEKAVRDPALMESLPGAADGARFVLSVCTGALILAEAGLLEGLAATTWGGGMSQLRRRFPGVRVLEGVRWVDNGKVITSAGVSAGIDAALHLVERILGSEEAERVGEYMEYGGVGGPGIDLRTPGQVT